MIKIDDDGKVNFKTIKANEVYFKLCSKCGSFNYYKNTECVTCKRSKCFDDSSRYEVNTFREIEKEYEFYKEQSFNDADIDEIKVTVK